jgi:hypothetical protein
MARISTASAVLGPCVAVAVAVGLAACSADDPAHRSFRPQVITASGVPYSGNGIAALDPQAVVTRTIKDTSSAPTVHLSGTLTGVPVPAASTASSSSGTSGYTSGSDPDAVSSASSSAVPTAAGTFSLDMVFTQFGAVGDLTNGSATSRLLRVEDEVWAAQPSSFWKAAGASGGGKAYGGLYVKVPSADPRYAGFTNDTRIGYLLDRLLQTSATWKKGPVGTVNGSAALELNGTGKDGHTASIWVATDGEPYILRIAPTAGSYRGQIDFTGYGERLAVQAPLPGQVLDNALLVLPSLTPSALASSASDSRTGGATGTSSPSSPSSTNPTGHTSSASASASSSPSASPDTSPTGQRSPGGGAGH